MNRRVILAAAASIVAVSLMGGCASTDETPPFQPRALGDPQRDAAAGLARSEAVPLPAKLESLADSKVTPKEKFRGEPLLRPLKDRGRVVDLDLRNAIQRAVVNNLDVRVASYTPAIEETRVTEADARFDPTAFFNATHEWNRGYTAFATGQFGQNASDFNRLNVETGIKQQLDTGGEYTLQWQSQMIDDRNDPDASTLNPFSGGRQYFQELKLQITQPILRDFGRDVNQARIVINKNNQQIALLDFREDLEKTLADLEKFYWQLVQARREVEIQQELLQNTINTANTLYLRRETDVNRLQISQANASVETRRAQLVRAKANVADLSDQIKRLMSDPSLPVGGPDLVLPKTDPLVQQVLIDPQEQIEMALLNRQELGQQQLRVGSALTALGVAKNNRLPRLDIVSSFSVQGLDHKFDSSFQDFFENDGNGGYNGVATLGFQFEYPLGNRAARAIYRRAQLQYLQATDSYRQIIEQVITDVQIAARGVDTTWSEIVRSRQAVLAAADALRSVQVREDAGEALTPEFVDLKLRQQELLANAQRDEAAAISGYNIALSALERAKGTLLKYNNVVMGEASLPKGS